MSFLCLVLTKKTKNQHPTGSQISGMAVMYCHHILTIKSIQKPHFSLQTNMYMIRWASCLTSYQRLSSSSEICSLHYLGKKHQITPNERNEQNSLRDGSRGIHHLVPCQDAPQKRLHRERSSSHQPKRYAVLPYNQFDYLFISSRS